MSKDVELGRIIEEKVDLTINEPLSARINTTESRDVTELVKKINLKSEDDFGKSRNRGTPDPWTIDLNHGDYATIIDGLNSNSTKTKIKILDKLLNLQIIDTRQNWEEVSHGLRNCILSPSNDIFIKTLKIHHRIITFPSTSCDGYVNLLKSTFLLVNSRFYDLNKNRILQSIKLIIDAQNVVIKFLLHASRNIIDDTITAFIMVITFKSIFDWFGVLDPELTWLKNFCYGAYIRTVFFNTLKEKKPDFIKNIVTEFVTKINNNDQAGFVYGNFLLHFWQYKINITFLPPEIGPESTLEAILSKFTQRKNLGFTNFVADLFHNNPSLLTPKLLDVLVEPLSNINRTNIHNLVETHSYIFTIVTNIAKSPNFRILFGICSSRKGKSRQTRNYINLPQKITDVTVILLKMSTMDEEIDQKSLKILPLLLNCCGAIFQSHPVSTTHVNPTKLVENLQEFYRLSWKNDTSVRTAFLSLFNFFFTSFGPTVKVLSCDSEILLELLSFTSIEDFKPIIGIIGSDKIGFDFLKTHRRQIIKPYLEQIWSCEDINDDFDLTKFIFFLFVVKTNTRSVVALLSDDDDDDNTIVETGDKSVSLVDLIEKTLYGTGDFEEEYLGLIAMKVLIMNLDLLLYLQTNHQMQENLTDLGEREENKIIDARSSLRNQILASLEFVGFVGDKSNETEETELVKLPQIFEFLPSDTEENEFRLFLQTSDSSGEFSWLAQARRLFKNSLNHFDPSLLTILLDQIPKTYVYRKIELNWPPSDCVYYQFHPEDFSGISLVISFGQKRGLLKLLEDNTHDENLALLLKQSRAFMGHRPEAFSNFDWFVAIVYLLCSGDFDKCKNFLVNVTNTQVTSLIWATFGKEFDDSFQENFYQHLGVVLEENCSSFQAMKLCATLDYSFSNKIHSVLRGLSPLNLMPIVWRESRSKSRLQWTMAQKSLFTQSTLLNLMLRISPETLVQSWLNQCFFNILRFEEIWNFLAFAILHPGECVLYYLVAIFHHLNDTTCALTHSLQLQHIFDMPDLSDFRLSNYIPLIETLMKRYRNTHKL